MKSIILDFAEREFAIKSSISKHQSPNIPSSKQLYPKKKVISSGLPRTYEKRKRGGSKKGKASPIWDQKEPNLIIHNYDNYVDKCPVCDKIANTEDQKFVHSKRIIELP